MGRKGSSTAFSFSFYLFVFFFFKWQRDYFRDALIARKTWFDCRENPLNIWGFKDPDIKFIPSFFWNIMSNNVTVYIFIFFNSLASIVSVRVMYDLVCDNCQNWESQKSINAAEIHMFDVDFYFEPTHILCPYFYCWCYCLDGPRQHPRKTHRQKDPQGAQTIISLPPQKKKCEGIKCVVKMYKKTYFKTLDKVCKGSRPKNILSGHVR